MAKPQRFVTACNNPDSRAELTLLKQSTDAKTDAWNRIFRVSAMIVPYRMSPFIDLVAVEAWDAWFRWRDATGLRDVAIEDTWRRIAFDLASVEIPIDAKRWRTRFLNALSSWKLLLDKRLLATAGTGTVTWGEGALHASLNAAAFVLTGDRASCSVDLAALADCAELALRALDNASLLAGLPNPYLRIGLVGVADALFLLQIEYDSERGRKTAEALARALAQGCFHASVLLAGERGAREANLARTIEAARRRGVDEAWVRDARRRGLRHVAMTAITSQRELALLCNVVADALDPLTGEDHAYVFVAPGGNRVLSSSGYALSVSRAERDRAHTETLQNLGCLPQLRMRAALQACLDEPIAYPLLVKAEPDEREWREANLQARRYGLPPVGWRNVSGTMYACTQSAAI